MSLKRITFKFMLTNMQSTFIFNTAGNEVNGQTKMLKKLTNEGWQAGAINTAGADL